MDLGSNPTDPEQAFVRPVVVVSDDRLHHPRLRMCVVVPGTSTIRRISLHMVLEPDADNGLDALTAFQPDRLQDRIGRVGAIGLAQIDELLRTVLNL